MFTWLNQIIGSVQNLVFAGLALAAIIMVVNIFWRTKALIPTVAAMLTAGIALWGVHNLSWFSTNVGNDANNPSASGPTTVHRPPLPSDPTGKVITLTRATGAAPVVVVAA